jgi:hypothetical protein
MTNLSILESVNAEVVLSYTNGKKTKVVHTATALAVAPLSVRVSAGQVADTKAFDNGQFNPAFQAVLASLNPGQLKALEAHFVDAYSVEVDGVKLAPVGPAIPARANRRSMETLAQWLANPTAIVKKETISKPLTKSQMAVAGAVLFYFGAPSEAPSEALSEAPSEAPSEV